MFEFAQYSTTILLAPPHSVNTELDIPGAFVSGSSVVRICVFHTRQGVPLTLGALHQTGMRTCLLGHLLMWL